MTGESLRRGVLIICIWAWRSVCYEARILVGADFDRLCQASPDWTSTPWRWPCRQKVCEL